MPASNKRKVDKPSKRVEIGLVPVIIISILAFGIYAFLSERPIREVCFPITVGLGVFTALRIIWFFLEIIIHQKGIKQTRSLLIKPSTTSGDWEHGFWIRLITCIIGLYPVPSLERCFESKLIDISVLLYTIMVGIHFQWDDCALRESHRLEKPYSYSGGSAMAFSFYYGYLRLIAPGLVKRLETFCDDQGIDKKQMPNKKLYILLPSSSFVFDKLDGYQKMTKTQDLKIDHVGEKLVHHTQDRGLVKGRTYKNTMYIVEYSDIEKYYILLEGATPLKTFYETCKEHNEFEKHKTEVVTAFYGTLKKLIREDKEMKDIVKLIYYNDEKRDVTIPEIVKERILKKPNKNKND